MLLFEISSKLPFAKLNHLMLFKLLCATLPSASSSVADSNFQQGRNLRSFAIGTLFSAFGSFFLLRFLCSFSY
eukprot:c20707_g1_i1 orf=453-671(+)